MAQVDPVPSPLPGGVTEVIRFFMGLPPWIQIGGALAGGVLAVVVLVLGWRHRARIVARVAALPAPAKLAALVVVGIGVLVAGTAGYKTYDYVEHDNAFCTGCHVMADAYIRFEQSAHYQLGCHDCHQQPLSASLRQLYLWVVERPHEVGTHAPVPDRLCASCHIDNDPERWPQIAGSIGHRVHFESDHDDLGELMCVSCHGVTVHEFAPVSATCGECHGQESEIQLGRMAASTEMHCVFCHDFLGREPVELPGATDQVAMLPNRTECLACHEMTELWEETELELDPHGLVCGACHNPHIQARPADAVQTCQECHVGADTITIFHTGTHAPVLPNCTECHQAHSWRVDGLDCLSCHTTIMEDPLRGEAGRDERALAAPAGQAPSDAGFTASPFLRISPHAPAGQAGPYDSGDVYGAVRVAETASLAAMASDRAVRLPIQAVSDPRPFRHRDHEAVSCQECHGTGAEHGVLTVRTPRDCAACHHDERRGYACADCHRESDLPARDVSAVMDLTVHDDPLSRPLPFDHGLHTAAVCQDCHTGGVFLAVETTCTACHADHHRPAADCATCHLPEPSAHGLEAHLTCSNSGCHGGDAGVRPALSRTLCLTCHADQRTHEPGLDCHVCHMVPDQPPVPPAPRPRTAFPALPVRR